MLTPTIIFLLAALPNFCEQKVKLEKSSHIWHHTRNLTRSYVCLQLSLHLHFLAKGGGEQSIKRVQKYDLYHKHDRRIWKMAIIIILQWFIWLQIGFFSCIQFRASVWDFFFGCVDVKISSEFNLPILYDSVSLEYSLFLLLWIKLDVMISQLVISNLISTRSFEGRKKYCLDFFL